VNANQKANQIEGGEAELRKRYALCGALLSQKRIAPYIYILSDEDSFDDNVTSVVSEFEVERSPRNFLHMHAVIVVKHTMYHGVRLSYPKLQAAFSKILGVKKAHCDFKLIRGVEDGLAAAKAYIVKDKKSTTANTEEE
jgi:hypothetical protein